MRVLLVSDDTGPDDLAAELRERGLSVDMAPPTSTGKQAGLAALAGGLRAFERLLTAGAPSAVVVDSASDAALAAVLVASKLGVPTARLDPSDRAPAGTEVNRTVIEQLADAVLARDPEAVAAWARA
jgi:hypothetical protein